MSELSVRWTLTVLLDTAISNRANALQIVLCINWLEISLMDAIVKKTKNAHLDTVGIELVKVFRQEPMDSIVMWIPIAILEDVTIWTINALLGAKLEDASVS